MKWILESEVFQDEDEPIIDALSELGIDHVLTKFGTTYEQYIEDSKQSDVIFHGSLQFAKLASRTSSWQGVWCNLREFECSFYYPRFGEHLLNSDYVMFSFGDLARKKSWIAEKVAVDGKVFLRPSSGFKTFTGKVVDVSKWDREMSSLGFRMDPESLVLAVPPQKVCKEWRTVVKSGEIVAASQYMEDGEICKNAEVPGRVIEYGRSVLNTVRYEPDPIWTMDICETEDGRLRVLEVGSFSCSGLYLCDPRAIIAAAKQTLEEELS